MKNQPFFIKNNKKMSKKSDIKESIFKMTTAVKKEQK